MKGIVEQVKELLELGLKEINIAGLTREEIGEMPSLAEWYDINVGRLREEWPHGVEYLGLITDSHWQELMHRVEVDMEVNLWMIGRIGE